MCGIVGIVGNNTNGLESATNSLKHRGPDETQFYHKDQFHVGFTRLAIIDIATGSQPIQSSDENYCIAFNGEIYNFQELRKKLEGEFVFKTKGDAEVILNMFIKYGPEMVQYLNGMFAISIYDFKKKQLYLFRDHVGIKPLFYSQNSEGFVFASELNALKQLCGSLKINEQIIQYYLSMLYIPSPWTIYKEISSLEPGHYLCYDGKITITQYWKPIVREISSDIEECKQRIKVVLEQAVKQQLIGERPLGIFLSGGVDSSLISYFASKHLKELKTFTITVEGLNEQQYASALSKRIGSIHKEVNLPKMELELLNNSILRYGQPFADSSLLPTYMVSKLTSQDVTVALAGDGGDELFCGYDYRYEKALSSVGCDDFFDNYYFRVSEAFKRKFLLKSDETTFSFLNRKLVLDKEDSPINTSRLFDIRFFLESMLTKVDISSMANSLEVRVPFLCQQVVDTALQIPMEHLFDGKMCKKVLKEILCEVMPREFVYRPKMGLMVPLRDWAKELAGILLRGLNKDPIWQLNIWNIEEISKFLRYSESGFRDSRKPHNSHSASFIFALYVLNYWLKA